MSQPPATPSAQPNGSSRVSPVQPSQSAAAGPSTMASSGDNAGSASASNAASAGSQQPMETTSGSVPAPSQASPTSHAQQPDPNVSSQPPYQQQQQQQSGQQPLRDPTTEAQENRRQALMKREEEEARKDRSLAELLGMLDGYRPVIPEEVTDYYLQKSGFESHDPRLNRLLSISAEKFISDIVSDAYQYSRIRTSATSGRPPAGGGMAAAAAGLSGPGGAQGAGAAGGPAAGSGAGGAAGTGVSGQDRSRTVLTMDDLSSALAEYGINAKRADSYR